ncbi:MAG: gamma-glutamylcyclotransferase family protein [Pseudomonadota bacterium]
MNRLFVYGTLMPGGPNEHVLQPLGGAWQPAYAIGRLQHQGWGAELGYPGLVPDPEGVKIPGQLLETAALRNAWTELDQFEGAEYQRICTTVYLEDDQPVEAQTYVLRTDDPGQPGCSREGIRAHARDQGPSQ